MTTNQALVDLDRLPRLFPHGVARAAELTALGLSDEHIHRYCGPTGPWQRLSDGVVLLSGAMPARQQRLQAALGVAASGAVVTGREAMWLHGVRIPAKGAIHLLVTGRAPERDDGSVVVQRVSRLPDAQWRHRFPVAPLARATVDACLRSRAYGDVRLLVIEAMQQRGLTLDHIHRELGPRRLKGSGPLRAVLIELSGTVRTMREHAARRAVELAALPPPTWGARLSTHDNVHLGTVDAWWPDVGFAWDADINRPGESAEEVTSTRLSRFLAAGVVAVHTVPVRLREHGEAVARELKSLYDLASCMPTPEVRMDR